MVSQHWCLKSSQSSQAAVILSVDMLDSYCSASFSGGGTGGLVLPELANTWLRRDARSESSWKRRVSLSAVLLTVCTDAHGPLSVRLDLNRASGQAVGVEQQVAGLCLDILPLVGTQGCWKHNNATWDWKSDHEISNGEKSQSTWLFRLHNNQQLGKKRFFQLRLVKVGKKMNTKQ